MPTPCRYFIELSYNGTAYHGWQIQPNSITVQQILDKALSTLFRQEVASLGCGRTDTGVHAAQFFAHFDLDKGMTDMEAKIRNLNALLPWDIAAKRFITVQQNSHARFDALSRSYQYHIHFNKSPFKHNLSWFLRDIPDVESMKKAALILTEYTDFSCFSKSNTQVYTNNCNIKKAHLEWDGDSLKFYITADRFLRNMVRAIVGTLMEVGKGRIKPEQIREIIESKSRSKAGTSVPACGLYLTEVVYPYINPVHG